MQNILFHSSGFRTIYNVYCAWDGRAWAEKNGTPRKRLDELTKIFLKIKLESEVLLYFCRFGMMHILEYIIKSFAIKITK